MSSWDSETHSTTKAEHGWESYPKASLCATLPSPSEQNPAERQPWALMPEQDGFSAELPLLHPKEIQNQLQNCDVLGWSG